MTISKDPDDRMGVFKRLGDVPPKRRFETFAEAFEGRDVWGEWETWRTKTRGERNQQGQERVERSERRWKAHMDERGRHHALARPMDVETFSARLLGDVAVHTAYISYWVHIEQFYTWLQYHPDFPHAYNPVWMAAAQYDKTNRLWNQKIADR